MALGEHLRNEKENIKSLVYPTNLATPHIHPKHNILSFTILQLLIPALFSNNPHTFFLKVTEALA